MHSTTLSATLAFLALAAPGMAEVTVLGWPGGPEEVALRAAAEAYNAREGLSEEDRVALLFTSRDGYYDKLAADLAAGTTSFDAQQIATYSIGRYAPFMTPVDLGPDAAATFGESVLATMQYDGKQFGVPTDLSLHFLYYRTDLIEGLLADPDAATHYSEIAEEHLGEALTPKMPDEWTWKDWAATALYFSQAVNPDSPVRYGTVLQMKNLLFNIMVFQSLPRAYGGDWMDEAGKVTVDSDAYRTGLELYKLLYDAGATPPDSTGYEFAEANAAYASGQVATMVQWNAAAAELTDREKAPAVAEVTATIAPPSGPEGRFTHVHSLGFGLNAAAEHKEGAQRFLQWLATPEAMAVYARAGGAPGLTGAALDAVVADRPDLAPLGEYAGNYGYVMRGGTSANALAVYQLQAAEFTGYWAGNEDLDQALADTTKGMTELLAGQ
jgi:multiple sugar transport system substrate-binding protein